MKKLLILILILASTFGCSCVKRNEFRQLQEQVDMLIKWNKQQDEKEHIHRALIDLKVDKFEYQILLDKLRKLSDI